MELMAKKNNGKEQVYTISFTRRNLILFLSTAITIFGLITATYLVKYNQDTRKFAGEAMNEKEDKPDQSVQQAQPQAPAPNQVISQIPIPTSSIRQFSMQARPKGPSANQQFIMAAPTVTNNSTANSTNFGEPIHGKDNDRAGTNGNDKAKANFANAIADKVFDAYQAGRLHDADGSVLKDLNLTTNQNDRDKIWKAATGKDQIITEAEYQTFNNSGAVTVKDALGKSINKNNGARIYVTREEANKVAAQTAETFNNQIEQILVNAGMADWWQHPDQAIKPPEGYTTDQAKAFMEQYKVFLDNWYSGKVNLNIQTNKFEANPNYTGKPDTAMSPIKDITVDRSTGIATTTWKDGSISRYDPSKGTTTTEKKDGTKIVQSGITNEIWITNPNHSSVYVDPNGVSTYTSPTGQKTTGTANDFNIQDKISHSSIPVDSGVTVKKDDHGNITQSCYGGSCHDVHSIDNVDDSSGGPCQGCSVNPDGTLRTADGINWQAGDFVNCHSDGTC